LWGTFERKHLSIRLKKESPVANFINILRAAFSKVFFQQNKTIIREKLCNALLYKKGKSKMLMKLTQGVNFINVKCSCFCTNVILAAFSSNPHVVKAAETYVRTKNLYVECWWNWALVDLEKVDSKVRQNNEKFDEGNLYIKSAFRRQNNFQALSLVVDYNFKNAAFSV